MQRTKKKIQKKANLILTADWHLRDTSPRFRDKEEFEESQWYNVDQVRQLQMEHDCVVLHAGDLFHVSNPSSYLLAKTIINLPERFRTVYGQHDLENHNFDLRHKSGIEVLKQAGVIMVYEDGSFGDSAPGELFRSYLEQSIGVWHKFVWDGKTIPWPNCKEQTAKQILKEHKSFGLIVTGDHHRPFTYKYKDRLLVNCGCLTRQASDYIDHRPRVYLWYEKDNHVEPFYLDVKKDIMIPEYQAKKEKSEELDAFVEVLSTDIEAFVSFEKTLKSQMDKDKVKKKLRKIIKQSLSYDGR